MDITTEEMKVWIQRLYSSGHKPSQILTALKQAGIGREMADYLYFSLNLDPDAVSFIYSWFYGSISDQMIDFLIGRMLDGKGNITANLSMPNGNSLDYCLMPKTLFTISQDSKMLYSGETSAGLEVKITQRGEVAWAFESACSSNWPEAGERIAWLRYLLFAPSIGMIDQHCRLTIDGQESRQISGVINGATINIEFLNVVIDVKLPIFDTVQLEEPWESLRKNLLDDIK